MEPCFRHTTLVHPDHRLTHFAYVLQQRIAQALCNGGAGGNVIWDNVLFVDQGDPGAVPARNYWTRKFPTIQSAINAALAGDTIWVNPGSYSENIDLTNIPDNVTLQGSGINQTAIIASTNSTPTVSFIPTVPRPITLLTIRDITILRSLISPANSALEVDCTNDPSSFDTGAFVLFNVRLIGEVVLRAFNNFRCDSSIYEDTVFVGNIGNADFIDSRFDDILTLDYDYSNALPSLGRGTYEFIQCSMARLVLQNTINATFNADCNVRGGVRGILLYDQTGDEHPFITFRGTIDKGLLVDYTDINEHGVQIADFDHAKLNGDFIWRSTVGNTGLFRVQARNATFESVQDNGISADGINQGGSGTFCEMDLLNSTFRQSWLDVTSYGIDRTLHIINPFVDYEDPVPVPPATITINILPKYVNTNYTIHADIQYPSGFPVFEYTSKTNASFDVTASVGSSPSFRLIQQLRT